MLNLRTRLPNKMALTNPLPPSSREKESGKRVSQKFLTLLRLKKGWLCRMEDFKISFIKSLRHGRIDFAPSFC